MQNLQFFVSYQCFSELDVGYLWKSTFLEIHPYNGLVMFVNTSSFVWMIQRPKCAHNQSCSTSGLVPVHSFVQWGHLFSAWSECIRSLRHPKLCLFCKTIAEQGAHPKLKTRYSPEKLTAFAQYTISLKIPNWIGHNRNRYLQTYKVQIKYQVHGTSLLTRIMPWSDC